tara:strand:+ start:97 stop:429 length:333 start_codon:yes stop_codon:yes gene_type:complete
MCQKSNAEFSAYTKVKMDNFSLVKKKTLKWFKSSKNFERGFCINCGSSLFFKKINNKKEISVSSGSLNKKIPIIGHIYYKNKKSKLNVINLKKFSQSAKGYFDKYMYKIK